MPAPITIIRPKKVFHLSDLEELWQYRELLYFFSWRDLKVRYKQTLVGIGWAVFQPLITMVIFSIFFGQLAKIPSDGAPYPIFVYVGLLFWQFFSSALTDTSNALISNQSIITKVYFPRLILPISSVATRFVDFCISAAVLFGMMIYYGFYPELSGLFVLPILLLITFMAATGLGLVLSALNVKYRDVRYVLPFFIQLLMFLTPVIYPASLTGRFAGFLAINPMMGVIQNARAAVLGTTPVDYSLLITSLLGTLILLLIGVYIFKKTERYFADIL